MRQRSDLFLPVTFLLLVVSIIASLTLGRYAVPTSDVIRIVFGTWPFAATRHYTDTKWVVVEIIRLPRILEATFCGMGLGLAGAAMQGVFRNPLVGPEDTGVSPAAAFGGVLAILLDWPTGAIVGSAFTFGMLALVLVFAIARFADRASTLTLILTGVIVGMFFLALVGLAQYFADPRSQLPQITYWLLGSFAGASYEKVVVISLALLAGGTALLSLRWRINLLSLGEIDAQGLGVNVELLRWCVVACVALIVAAQVSISGGIAFVGLIVPHFARMLVGAEHTKLLPAAALLGGIYLLGMDDIARSATQQEIPIGLLTAVIGAPIFALLLTRQKGRGWMHD